MTTFMGTKYHNFVVKSSDTEAQVHLMARSQADALYTAAELLDEELDHLQVFRPTDW